MSLGLIYGTVALVDHDSEWETIADQTIESLWRVFGSVATDIQHIGSTAVNGIKAKPSIGIVVAVNHLEFIESLFPAMEQEGFIFTYGYKEDEWKIIIYTDKSHSIETHSILIVKHDNPRYMESLCFRDYLNANPTAAKRYEIHKLKIAAKSNNDRSVYKTNKSDFMKCLLEEAMIWSSDKIAFWEKM